ncbi:MAG TPA: hypothetical protein VI277_06820, partial [Candidatus Limnocylindria bacterium]
IVGHPLTAAVVSAVFLSALVLHATVIWQDPVEQALAGGVAVLTALLVVWILRGPAFRPAAAIEIRDAERGATAEPGFSVVVAGRHQAADVRLLNADGRSEIRAATGEIRLAGLERATFTLADPAVRELKVWAHRVMADGDSIPIAGAIALEGDSPRGLVQDGSGAARTTVDRDSSLTVSFRPGATGDTAG